MGPHHHPASHSHAHPPLHKSPAFLLLSGLLGLFLMLSLILHARLQDWDLDDDNGIAGSGGGDGLWRDILLRRRKHNDHDNGHHHHHAKKDPTQRKRQATTDNDSQNNDDDDDDDEPSAAILKFQKDQHIQKRQRQHQGLLTPRETFEQEQFDPDDWDRIRAVVGNLRQPDPTTALGSSTSPDQAAPYDIHHCPLEPPPGYPVAWNVMTVLENWNPDDTTIPTSIYQGLCVLDWDDENDRTKAEHYRRREVPFVLQHMPEVLRASERWMTPGYLEDLIGDEQVFNEHSRDNHFMYWKTKHPHAADQNYVPPTDTVDLTYREWLAKAQAVQETTKHSTQQEHWYFRLNAMLHNHAYLYEELPWFDPTNGKSLTMVHPNQHRGINCRFGMKGVIAEAHYDSHNNFIALMGGQRRYVYRTCMFYTAVVARRRVCVGRDAARCCLGVGAGH